MLIAPSKIKLNKIFKNRTFNFETVKKTRGNLIIIGSRSRSDLEMVVTSKLFKPQQLYSAFTPRLFKPLNLKLVRQNQKEIYGLMKKNTGGRIKITKPMFNSYNGLNIAYDISAEFNGTAEILERRKQLAGLQKVLIESFENLVSTKVEEANYEKNYIVFPMATYIDGFRRLVKTDITVTDPMILFLKSISRGFINKEAFSKIDAIFFYNPNAQAIIRIDINDP